MPTGVPLVLAELLAARDSSEQDRAWERFVSEYSRVILHAIRECGGSRDTVMDRYAFALDHLRANDLRKLRAWESDGRSQLTTWLTVVVKRLCLDHHRQTYGRNRAAGHGALEDRERRRQLADLVALEINPEIAANGANGDAPPDDPELALRRHELYGTLARDVAALPPDDRMLLTLRFRDELSAARIARVMRLPTPFHVYRKLSTLLQALRRSLEQHGVEDSSP